MKLTSRFQRYGLAAISCGLALAVAWPLDAPSSCFFLAVMVSSLYGGRGPGLLAIALSAVAFDYFFLPPRFQFSIEPASDLRFAAFLGAAVLIAVLIEAKRRAEESHRLLNAQYRTVSDTAPDAIFSIDGESRILFMNPAATRLFGWAPPELLGKPLTLLLPDFVLGGCLSGAELVGRRKDGSEFSAEVSFGEVGAGNRSNFTGFVRDISERKRAEAALQKSESYLAEAQTLSKTGSFGWNAATAELFWSQEIFRIAGLDPAMKPSLELLLERIHPEDRARVQQVMERASRSGDELDFEHRFLMPDGAVKHVRVLAHSVKTGSGKYVGAAMDITAQVRAEEELRRSEAYLLESERLSHTGSWVWDVEHGQPVYWSAEMCRIHGRDPGQGPPPIEEYRALHAADWAELSEAVLKSARDKTDMDYNSRVVLPGGSIKYTRVVGHPVTNAAGDVTAIIGTTVDVTEQHHATLALEQAFDAVQRSEDRLRTIISTIPALAWSTLPDGSAEFLNQRWLDYTGLSPEQALGWGWGVAIHPDDLPDLLKRYREYLAAGVPFETEARLRRYDGEFRWFLFRGSPLRDENGNLVKWYGTNTDIEDRRRAEEAVRASEHNFRLIVDSIPGLVSTNTAAGEVETVNRQIVDYTGKTLEELKSWATIVHPDDLEMAASLWERSVKSGAPFEGEYRLLGADGTYRWFHARGLPVRDNDGGIVRWYHLVTDIEDRKNAEEALRRTQNGLARALRIATVGELAASIAHEVNQPLSAVVANGHASLRWLLAEPPNLAKVREATERIVRDGKDAGEVVRRIRALFKRSAIEKVPLDLNDIIGEVLRLLRGETARRSVAVEIDLDRNLPPVLGDRIQLQQLMFNLISNGLDAMDSVFDRPRKLCIQSQCQCPGNVLVKVADCGIGLQDPDKVFEAFFTTKENGMGMGLSICRSIIEAHEGRLWAEAHEGPGATFCFTLPLKSSELT